VCRALAYALGGERQTNIDAMTDRLVAERGGYFAELVEKHGVLAVPSGGTPSYSPAAAFLHSRRLADAILDCEAALLGRTNVVHLRNLRIVHDYVDPASPRERAGGPIRTK
jgi:hypothetical protein